MKLKKTLLLFSAITMPAASIIGTLSCSIYTGDFIINTTENSFKGIYQGISRLVPSGKYDGTLFSFDKPAEDISQAFIAWKSMNNHYDGNPSGSNRQTLMYFSGFGKQMLFIDKDTNKETFLIAQWPENRDYSSTSSNNLNAQINATLEWEGASKQYNPFSSYMNSQQASVIGKVKFLGPDFNPDNQSSLKYQKENAIPTFFTHDQGLYVMKVSLKMIELLSQKTSTHFPFDLSTQSYIMSLVTYINYKVADFDFGNSATIESVANFLIDINKKDNDDPSKKKSRMTKDNIEKIHHTLELSGYFDANTMKQAALKIIKQRRNSSDAN